MQWWLIDTDPILLLVMSAAIAMGIASNPKILAKISLATMSAGVICLFTAKVSLMRRGIWTSWGTGGMTKWNARLYWAGYAGMASGVILLLLALLVTRYTLMPSLS